MADNAAGQTRVVSNDQATGQIAAGKITYDATAITTTDYTRIECGFQPRYIYWLNLTDRITVELDIAPVIARLDQLLRTLGPGGLQAPLAEIGEDLVESTKQRFATSTGPDGSRWAPNSMATIMGIIMRRRRAFQRKEERGTLRRAKK